MRNKLLTHPYYTYDKVDSYGAVFNLCVGGRSIGKTYGAKVKSVARAVRRGEQFILLRRYNTELETRSTFFADFAHEFPDYDFRVFGHEAQMSPISAREDKKRAWTTIGFFVALSTAQTKKGSSYARVTTIIFDEFLIEKGHLQYLKSEFKALLSFYVTVDRNQERTKVYMLANSVTMDNPYFDYLKFNPDGAREFTKCGVDAAGRPFAVIHLIDSEAFEKSISQTRLSQFTMGTEFYDMSVKNTFHDAHQKLLSPKTPVAKYTFTLETKRGKFSIWHDITTGNFYAQEKLPGQQVRFTLLPEKVGDGWALMLTSDKPLKDLRRAWRNGRMFFDQQRTRNNFIDVFK